MSTLDRIKQLMEQRGWSIYKLAQESEVLQSTLSNMFNRSHDPSISTLESLCKGFGITMAEFFANEGEPITLTIEQMGVLRNWGMLNEKQKQAFSIIFESISNA